MPAPSWTHDDRSTALRARGLRVNPIRPGQVATSPGRRVGIRHQDNSPSRRTNKPRYTAERATTDGTCRIPTLHPTSYNEARAMVSTSATASQ